MKRQKKGLQKFTESKIDELMKLEQITAEDLLKLNSEERDQFNTIITEKLNTLKNQERDLFLRKIEPITVQDTKNQLWDYNHNKIIQALNTFIKDYGRMPTNIEISTSTDLSRQTIHKHLKEFSKHPLYIEECEKFKIMASKVLARVFSYAVNGDIKAAKVYLQFIGYMNLQTRNTNIKHQSNFIQINGTVLSQEQIKMLDHLQLAKIESILKEALKSEIEEIYI